MLNSFLVKIRSTYRVTKTITEIKFLISSNNNINIQ